MNKFKLMALAGFLSVFSLPALAAPIETTFGGIPGGTTFSGSGTGYQFAGGATWDIGLTDPSQVDQIWFAFDDIVAGMDGTASALSFTSGIGTNTAVWTGSDVVTLASGSAAITTRFTAVLNDGGTWIAPGSVGIAGGPAVVTEWEDPNNLNVTFYLEASTNNGLSYSPFLTLFDNLQTCSTCGGNAVSGFFTKYYYTTPVNEAIAVVPIPAALPLLMSALGFFGFFGWRRKRMAA